MQLVIEMATTKIRKNFFFNRIKKVIFKSILYVITKFLEKNLI